LQTEQIGGSSIGPQVLVPLDRLLKLRFAERCSLDIWWFTEAKLGDVGSVPEGLLESRPAIYRRYWVLEFDLVPQGRLKLRFTDGRYIRFAQRHG
jgi:hypothetical protein